MNHTNYNVNFIMLRLLEVMEVVFHTDISRRDGENICVHYNEAGYIIDELQLKAATSN